MGSISISSFPIVRMVINPILGIYIPIRIGFPIKGGMTIPNIHKLDPSTYANRGGRRSLMQVQIRLGFDMFCKSHFLTIDYRPQRKTGMLIPRDFLTHQWWNMMDDFTYPYWVVTWVVHTFVPKIPTYPLELTTDPEPPMKESFLLGEFWDDYLR